MRNCNLQLRSTHGVQTVFFVAFHTFYVCLSGKKYQCHFHHRLHHRYPAIWIKKLGKDGSTVSS